MLYLALLHIECHIEFVLVAILCLYLAVAKDEYFHKKTQLMLQLKQYPIFLYSSAYYGTRNGTCADFNTIERHLRMKTFSTGEQYAIVSAYVANIGQEFIIDL